MADIDVSSSRCAGYVAVALRGELDIRQATPLARALSAAAASGPPVIVELGIDRHGPQRPGRAGICAATGTAGRW
jgi:hypothetical protein